MPIWSKVMTSEVEQRPRLVTADYGWHRRQWEYTVISNFCGFNYFWGKKWQGRQKEILDKLVPIACSLMIFFSNKNFDITAQKYRPTDHLENKIGCETMELYMNWAKNDIKSTFCKITSFSNNLNKIWRGSYIVLTLDLKVQPQLSVDPWMSSSDKQRNGTF